MGARSYVPQLGRFLQPDPTPGGSANAYSYTFGDPVNSTDPSGEYTFVASYVARGDAEWAAGAEAREAARIAERRAAEEAAARAAAESAARAAAESAAAIAGPVYTSTWDEEWGEEEGTIGGAGGRGATTAGIHSWSVRMPSWTARGLGYALAVANSPQAGTFSGAPGWLVRVLEAGTRIELHQFATKLISVASIPDVAMVEISVFGTFKYGFHYTISGYL
jgi:hypothetical protein